MEIVGGNCLDAEGQFLANWFGENTGSKVNPPYSAMGFVKNGELKGVAIFNNHYENGNIEFHIYMPGCITRQTLKAVFNYVFNNLNCTIFTAKVNTKNKKFLRIVNKLNNKSFKCIIPDYYGPGEDAALHVFTRKWATKWIKIDAECAKSSESTRPESHGSRANAV